jgi:heme/copper-type cytochrome/quinol oxidase subunit 2
MSRVLQSDEQIVDKARRILAAKDKIRWIMLLYAVLFLGISGYFTLVGIRKIENLDAEQLKMGFVYGLALAVVWTSFGVLGAICLGKFLVGFGNDFRPQELLVRYHDQLRDLGQIPDEKNG